MARFGRAASRLCTSFYSVANFLCFVPDSETRHGKLITFGYLRSFNTYIHLNRQFSCSLIVHFVFRYGYLSERPWQVSLMPGHGFPPRSMSFRSFPLVLNAPVPAPSFILLMRSSVAGLHRSESRVLNPHNRSGRSLGILSMSCLVASPRQ